MPSSSSSTSSTFRSSTALGPVARNGLIYTDVIVGTGRRILPGDIVQCYYTGSYKKTSSNTSSSGGFPPFSVLQLLGGNNNNNNNNGGVIVFDSIQESDGLPFVFPVGKGLVIEGWDLGILGKADLDIPPMYVGGQRQLTIPAPLAYGSEGNGCIPANQALQFDIQIVNAVSAPSAISIQYRLTGYAVALTLPLLLFALAWTVLHNL